MERLLADKGLVREMGFRYSGSKKESNGEAKG